MRAIRSSLAIILLVGTSMSLASFARADSYSWTNFQSDIPGVATHTDPNLVNPWGMAANSTGTAIWVSDNGTGVSTIYQLDGTAASLVVSIPASAKRSKGANPTSIVMNSTSFFKVMKNGNS